MPSKPNFKPNSEDYIRPIALSSMASATPPPYSSRRHSESDANLTSTNLPGPSLPNSQTAASNTSSESEILCDQLSQADNINMNNSSSNSNSNNARRSSTQRRYTVDNGNNAPPVLKSSTIPSSRIPPTNVSPEISSSSHPRPAGLPLARSVSSKAVPPRPASRKPPAGSSSSLLATNIGGGDHPHEVSNSLPSSSSVFDNSVHSCVHSSDNIWTARRSVSAPKSTRLVTPIIGGDSLTSNFFTPSNKVSAFDSLHPPFFDSDNLEESLGFGNPLNPGSSGNSGNPGNLSFGELSGSTTNTSASGNDYFDTPPRMQRPTRISSLSEYSHDYSSFDAGDSSVFSSPLPNQLFSAFRQSSVPLTSVNLTTPERVHCTPVKTNSKRQVHTQIHEPGSNRRSGGPISLPRVSSGTSMDHDGAVVGDFEMERSIYHSGRSFSRRRSYTDLFHDCDPEGHNGDEKLSVVRNLSQVGAMAVNVQPMSPPRALTPSPKEAGSRRGGMKRRVRWRSFIGPSMFAIFTLFLVAIFLADLSYMLDLEERASKLSGLWDHHDLPFQKKGDSSLPQPVQDELLLTLDEEPPEPVAPMYENLLALAANFLVETQLEYKRKGLWEEPVQEAQSWKPCADHHLPTHRLPPGENETEGYILVSASGGINQQRAAVCNAVAVARMLNATLVVPYLLHVGPSHDTSRFEDIFEVNHFMETLKNDVRIVHQLPKDLSSLDLNAMGSIITDADLPKEALLPTYFNVRPLLRHNRVVHFYGFVNRLASDPVPFHLQRLRCLCNFHALRFKESLVNTAQLMVDRLRENSSRWGDSGLNFVPSEPQVSVNMSLEGEIASTLDTGSSSKDGQVNFLSSREDSAVGNDTKTQFFEEEEQGRSSLFSERKGWALGRLKAIQGRTRIQSGGGNFLGNESQLLVWERDGNRTEIQTITPREGQLKESGDYVRGTREPRKTDSSGDLGTAKFMALHMRFEIDVVAYSLCSFGGGQKEWEELRAYRKAHFPTLFKHEQAGKMQSPEWFRREGMCPLTPEEVALIIAALGFNRWTRIFMAGGSIYGGPGRVAMLQSLYPNLVTKETLLSPKELEPFVHSHSQLAALDYLVCSAANVFTVSDSGSQMAGLVTGHRIYWGEGHAPTIRPNKHRLSDIFGENATIEWHIFEEKIREAVESTLKVVERPLSRSVYRHPRCEECMCSIGKVQEKMPIEDNYSEEYQQKQEGNVIPAKKKTPKVSDMELQKQKEGRERAKRGELVQGNKSEEVEKRRKQGSDENNSSFHIHSEEKSSQETTFVENIQKLAAIQDRGVDGSKPEKEWLNENSNKNGNKTETRKEDLETEEMSMKREDALGSEWLEESDDKVLSNGGKGDLEVRIKDNRKSKQRMGSNEVKNRMFRGG